MFWKQHETTARDHLNRKKGGLFPDSANLFVWAKIVCQMALSSFFQTSLFSLFLAFYITANFHKTAAKGLFFSEISVKKPLCYWTVNRREKHNSKKAQHKDFLSSTYYKYKPKLGTMEKPFEQAVVEYQQC